MASSDGDARDARAARRAFIRLLRLGLPGPTTLARITRKFKALVPGVAEIPAADAIASIPAFEAIALTGLSNADGGNSQQSGVAGILLLCEALRRLGVDGGGGEQDSYLGPTTFLVGVQPPYSLRWDTESSADSSRQSSGVPFVALEMSTYGVLVEAIDIITPGGAGAFSDIGIVYRFAWASGADVHLVVFLWASICAP